LSASQPTPEPPAGGGASGFGVYVHVPVCTQRCDYCAFATWTDRGHLTDRYVAAVVTEARRAADHGAMREATSVFVGGGTPSLLSGAAMGQILDAIPRAAGAEVTIECNPDTVSAELFDAYVAHGVTRISFGVQSMVDRVLVALGRTHDRANVERGVALVQPGRDHQPVQPLQRHPARDAVGFQAVIALETAYDLARFAAEDAVKARGRLVGDGEGITEIGQRLLHGRDPRAVRGLRQRRRVIRGLLQLGFFAEPAG
jgi:oxygen-independent coproporphyrinogen-3 oxidase